MQSASDVLLIKNNDPDLIRNATITSPKTINNYLSNHCYTIPMEKDKAQNNDLLNAYSKATEAWTKSFQTMQEQATNAFKLYIQGFEQAMKSSNFDDMKKYNEIWQNLAKQFEQNPYQWSQKAWEDVWKESGLASFKTFFDHWQSVWQNFAKDAETKSKEALDKLQKQNKP